MALANVTLTNTFDEWRTRTNQLIIESEQTNFIAIASFNTANIANALSSNVSISANAYALATATAIGIAGNSYAVAIGASSNARANFVGVSANAYAVAQATAAGSGANNFASSLTTVTGQSANAYSSSLVGTVGTSANAYAASVGASGNAYALATVTSSNAFTSLVFGQANIARTHANSAYAKANSSSVSIVNDTATSVKYVTFTSSSSGNITSLNISSSSLTFNAATGTLTATNFDSSSDINKKENIVTIENALEKVEALNGVKFTWKNSGQPSAGIIAQDLQRVMPELVSPEMSVTYSGIIGILVEAIKELNDRIKKLESK